MLIRVRLSGLSGEDGAGLGQDESRDMPGGGGALTRVFAPWRSLWRRGRRKVGRVGEASNVRSGCFLRKMSESGKASMIRFVAGRIWPCLISFPNLTKLKFASSDEP